MMLLLEEEEMVSPGNGVGEDDAFTLLVLVARTGVYVETTLGELLVGDMVDAVPWRILYC